MLDVACCMLDLIPVPFYTILHGNKCCNNEAHKEPIKSYFRDIETAVLHADLFLPRTVPTIQKPYMLAYWLDM